MEEETKFCKFCGAKIPMDAVMCTSCGRQVEELKSSASAQPNIVINNSNNNSNTNINGGMMIGGRMKNKWVALLLCFFLVGVVHTDSMKVKLVLEYYGFVPVDFSLLAGLLISLFCYLNQIHIMYNGRYKCYLPIYYGFWELSVD